MLALTPDDRANLAIAVAARLLHPGMRTIARAQHPETMAALETCGVTEIINPYREFAERLAIAMRAPDTHRLLSLADRPARQRHQPPGARAARTLDRLRLRPLRRRDGADAREGGFDVTIVDPDEPPSPDLEIVHGLGSDEASLRDAGIAEAEGIVAGSDDDTANLAMAMAARQLKPGIFVILRQNRAAEPPPLRGLPRRDDHGAERDRRQRMPGDPAHPAPVALPRARLRPRQRLGRPR